MCVCVCVCVWCVLGEKTSDFGDIATSVICEIQSEIKILQVTEIFSFETLCPLTNWINCRENCSTKSTLYMYTSVAILGCLSYAVKFGTLLGSFLG